MSVRLDVWLDVACVFPTRSQAKAAIEGGKVDVNGAERHPVYDELVQVADQSGKQGDVQWNFEKFLVDGSGSVVARFDPTVVPDDPRVTGAIETVLG